MKNILYVYENGQETAHQHIIDYLQKNSYKVDILTITSRHYLPPPGDGFVNPRTLGKTSFISEYKNKYSCFIWNFHGSYRYKWIREFQRSSNLTDGVIDMEHDGFTRVPQHSPPNLSITTLAVHNKHYKWLKDRKLNTQKVRWYKLDSNYKKLEFTDLHQFEDAVLIGSSFPKTAKILEKGHPFEFRHLFRKVWYKKYLNDDIPKKTTYELPEYCNGAIGTKYCADIGKFWFICSSGCFFDALVFGSIPILYKMKFKEKKLNEIISIVNCSYGNKKEIRKGKIPISFKAVTCNDIDKKIKLLRNQSIFEETLQLLRKEWFTNTYFDLTSAHESIVSILNRKK